LIVLAIGAGLAYGQALSATKSSSAPPAEIAAPVAAKLSPDSFAVKVGDVPLELWWVKAIAAGDLPAGSKPSWAAVSDGTLVGAIRVGAPWSDIRGFGVKPGVYTLRYALQPQNGDHLGVSPNREFLLLAPAALDTTADPLGYKPAVELSKKAVNRAHPGALSLDPPVATRPPLSPVSIDTGLDGIVFAVPVSSGDQPVGELVFGLILRGSIQN
jgi:hypothetical protein